MITITLILFGLIILSYVAPFSNYIPDYWYIPVIILIYAIMIQITLTAKVELEDGNFIPINESVIPPKIEIDNDIFPIEFVKLIDPQKYRDMKIDEIL